MKIAYKINNEGINSNFLYSGVEYEYDDYVCKDSGCGCRDGSDYCRRSRYIGLRAKSVDLNSILDKFTEKSGKRKDLKTNNDTFVNYCVDRILRLNKVWDKENWEVSASYGYYGEEIDSITFNNLNKVNEEIINILSLSPDKRIERVLELEYGYLLEEIKDKKWKVETVFPSSISRNQEYYVKLSQCSYPDFNKNLPVCICRRDGEKYRLIDGYHRFMHETKIENNETFQVIVCE